MNSENLIKWPSNWDEKNIFFQAIACIPRFGELPKLRVHVENILRSRKGSSLSIFSNTLPGYTDFEISQFLQNLCVSGNWPCAHFYPKDSFSLLVHDWRFFDRSIFDYEILNRSAFSLLSPEDPSDFLDRISDSLKREGEIPCVNLPDEAVDWCIYDFLFWIKEKA